MGNLVDQQGFNRAALAGVRLRAGRQVVRAGGIGRGAGTANVRRDQLRPLFTQRARELIIPARDLAVSMVA